MISVFLVLQGNAEALIKRGAKIYHPPIARFQQSTSAKNYYNSATPAGVIAKNVGGVFY